MGTEFILFNAIEVNCKQANLSSILVKWGVIPGGGGTPYSRLLNLCCKSFC